MVLVTINKIEKISIFDKYFFVISFFSDPIISDCWFQPLLLCLSQNAKKKKRIDFVCLLLCLTPFTSLTVLFEHNPCVEDITCSLVLLYSSFPPGVKPVHLLIWFWNSKVIVTAGMPDYNSNHVFRFFQGITKHCWAFWVLHQQQVPSKCVASLSVIVIFSFLHIFTEKTGICGVF